MSRTKNTRRTRTATIIERNLGREKALGLCYLDEGVIEIDPRQEAKEYLDTIIHEMLHLTHPEWTEEEVYKTANSLSAAVWAANFRKIAL